MQLSVSHAVVVLHARCATRSDPIAADRCLDRAGGDVGSPHTAGLPVLQHQILVTAQLRHALGLGAQAMAVLCNTPAFEQGSR